MALSGLAPADPADVELVIEHGHARGAHAVEYLNAIVRAESLMSGMAMGHGVSVQAAVPPWLGFSGAAMFLAIAASHLRHLIQTIGERRPWHACHVLIAIGMAFMCAPASIGSLGVPATFWRLLFATAGMLAALWALGGTDRTPSPIWFLTALDLGAMFYMWSAHAFVAPLTWLLVAYFVVEAAMWALDVYRQLDRGPPSGSWRMLPQESGSRALTVPTAAATTTPRSLIGELDIGASMFAMALGMAYMLAAMQTMT